MDTWRALPCNLTPDFYNLELITGSFIYSIEPVLVYRRESGGYHCSNDFYSHYWGWVGEWMIRRLQPSLLFPDPDMADIDQLHPILFRAYTEAKAEYIRDHPKLPKPQLTFTYRSKAVQDAFYAQGRLSREAINALRKPLKLYLLGDIEARRKVTNAKGGQSPHNYLPSMAFDVAFISHNGVMDWSENHFKRFAPYVLKHPHVKWGGHFVNFPDFPHFEVDGWKALVAK